MSDEDDFEAAWFRPDRGAEARIDPIDAARRAAQMDRPRRFWREASVAEQDGRFVLMLDGRSARTPGRRPLSARTRALGAAMTQEWNAQGTFLDPISMPVTRLLNAAIDGVADQREAVRDEIVRYAGTDMLCYRADEPASLVVRQAAAWDPLIAWAAEALGAELLVTTGIMHRAQSTKALAAIQAAVAIDDPARLAALSTITTLTGSAILALAVAKGRLEAEAAWSAAHVDEDFQIERWGADEEATERRARRWAEMEAAARVFLVG